jgi:DME family drug/metabolite transporter
MEIKPAPRGEWLVLVAAVLWGTTGTAQALAPAGISPLSLGAARLAVGGLALLVYAFTRRAFQMHGAWPIWSTLTAAICMAAYQLMFFDGVRRTGIVIGTIVAIGSAPVLAGLIGLLWRGERPTSRWIYATILAVAGCTMLITSGDQVKIDRLGILLSLGAGASYAIFSVANKNVLVNQAPEAAQAVIFCLAAIALLPLLFNSRFTTGFNPGGLATALYLGLVATGLAYTLFGHGLKAIPAATAVTLSLAEPLTASLLGFFLIGERLSLGALIGAALVLGGLAVLSVSGKKVANAIG